MRYELGRPRAITGAAATFVVLGALEAAIAFQMVLVGVGAGLCDSCNSDQANAHADHVINWLFVVGCLIALGVAVLATRLILGRTNREIVTGRHQLIVALRGVGLAVLAPVVAAMFDSTFLGVGLAVLAGVGWGLMLQDTVKGAAAREAARFSR